MLQTNLLPFRPKPANHRGRKPIEGGKVVCSPKKANVEIMEVDNILGQEEVALPVHDEEVIAPPVPELGPDEFDPTSQSVIAEQNSTAQVAEPVAVSLRTPANHASEGSKEFSQFLGALEEYNPTFPENLTRYYMERAGFAVKDERILKLVSLAADKAMSQIIYEAKQVATLRQHGNRNAKRKSDRTNDSFEIDDLEASLSQFRIYIRKKKRKTDA